MPWHASSESASVALRYGIAECSLVLQVRRACSAGPPCFVEAVRRSASKSVIRPSNYFAGFHQSSTGV